MIYVGAVQTTIGTIFIVTKEEMLSGIYFEKEKEEIPSDAIWLETNLFYQVKQQLEEYFAGQRINFTLPLYIEGTTFMKKVWNALIEIPYGQVCSYKDISEKIGHPKAYRAVGLANNKNKIPIVIPCHRVIGSGGQLVGYGSGLPTKEKLLELEARVNNENNSRSLV